jgi:crotonobetaine/carnitine-CoA ligase
MNDSSRGRTLTQVLTAHANRFGDALFLVDERESYTYAAIEDLAARTAHGLAALGVVAGDTVAFFMENSARLALTAFAVNRLGAIWSPVNTDYRGEWLTVSLRDIRSRVLVVDAALLPQILALPALPFEHLVVYGRHTCSAPAGMTLHDLVAFDENPLTHPRVEALAGDTSAVLWTSGTTGRSKGVMQPHNAWLTAARRYNDDFLGGVRPGERFYSCVPMYNSGAWVSAIFPALVSAQTACIDRRFSVGQFWHRIRHHQANHVMLLGAMTAYLWNAPERRDDADNPLRTMFMVPVLSDILDTFMKRFGIGRVASGFGQSEVMLATTYHSDMPGLKPGSCGYLLDDSPLQTAILDDEDNPVPRRRDRRDLRAPPHPRRHLRRARPHRVDMGPRHRGTCVGTHP